MALLLSLSMGFAQTNEMKLKLNESGDQYIKATFLNQTWVRWNQSNPGTLVNGVPTDNTFDIGLRRTRIQLYGQLSKRVFFYTQFGQNNFNYLTQNAGNRKIEAFFHDALAEYSVTTGKNPLKIGSGLTIANGLSRFSQPSIGTIMSLDVPVFAQATVDQTDQFSRKLSLYARGQLGHLDYRLILSDPFPVQTNGASVPAISANSTFATMGHYKQYQALLIWNFFDREGHTTPYMTGSYLGKKRVLNLEAGFISQKNATWSLADGDTAYHNMLLWSVAGYLDMPTAKKDGSAYSAYLGYFNTNYGTNYLRYNGIMNPANGSTGEVTNGGGNALPMFGTGSVIYAQAGYKFKDELLKDQGTLMPYATFTRSSYERLADPVVLYDLGVNWLLHGNTSKITLDYQSRPEYVNQTAGLPTVNSRKSSVTMQYQVYF